MGQQFDPYEPMPDHLADTGPVRRVQEVAGWRRVVGLLSLLGAAGLTIATALLLLTPSSNPAPSPSDTTLAPTDTVEVIAPTATPVGNPQENPVAQSDTVPATLSPDALAMLLATPVVPLAQAAGLEISRDDYSAFTIIPDRPRSQVIQYEVQSGDTIFALSERFGVKPETIAWSNDRYIVEGLRVGKLLNILPVDGAYFTVISEKSIADIARDYHVDPYTIIDSEYNDLFGKTPDDVLPSGIRLVIPGGTQEQINWSPPVTRVDASSSSSGVGKISFDTGDPGSCGLVDNPGGTGGWIKPLSTYQWVRGFTPPIHFGVDLSDPIGTPVMAASAGTVVFSGWSNWGYGWSVVLAHGPYTTIYGHMSDVYARCGSYVNAGTTIGAVGSSGDSTGPHLHFEVRYNDSPVDPTGIMPF